MNALPFQGQTQFLHERFNRFRLKRETGLTRRLTGINTRLTVHAVELLGTVVERSEVAVAQLPGRGSSLLQLDPCKLLLPHPLEHTAPDLGVAAKGVDGLR